MFQALKAHHQVDSCNNTGIVVCVSTHWWRTLYHTRRYILVLYHNAYNVYLPDDEDLRLEACRR